MSVAIAAEPANASIVSIDIPAGTLAEAIGALSRQAKISVAVQGRLPRIVTPSVHGRMDPGEALARLLTGSGWTARQAAPLLWQIVRGPQRLRNQGISSKSPVAIQPPASEIVVTALKRDQALVSAPVAISVLTGDRFAGGSAARSSSDLADEVGSVFSTHLGPGKERLFLRGVADSPFNGPTQSTVGLFLDDARINFALPDPDLRMVDVDRVEVLRGPQGTLYGAGTLGGIIRIVTNRPKLNGVTEGNVAIEGLSVADGGIGRAMEGWINLPLKQDNLGVRASAYADIEGGWIDDSKRDRHDVNRSRRSGGRVEFRWKPGTRWTIDLSVAAQGLRNRDTQYATQDLTRATALAEPYRNDFLLVRLEARGPIGNVNFLSSTAIERNHIASRYDAGPQAGELGLLEPLAYDEDRSVYLITQEFRLSQSRGPLRWLAGVSIVDAINVNLGRFSAASGTSVEARAQANLSLEAAAFGEATVALAPRIDLTAGLRAYTSNIYDDPRATARPSINQYGLAPSAALSWRPFAGSLFWLRYANATRPGGRNLDGNGTLVTFRQDRLHNVELGSRLSLLNGHLDLDLTAFAFRWSNLQSDRVGLNGLIVTTNVGYATNHGIELSARGSASDLSLEVAFTGQHGRLHNGDAPDNEPRLPILPDISGRSRASWAKQVGSWALGAYVSGNYWGRSRLGFDPALPLDVPSRWSVGTGVSIGRDRWRAVLSAANLLDRRDDSFPFGNPFTYRLQPQHTPTQPRTVLVRIEHSF